MHLVTPQPERRRRRRPQAFRTSSPPAEDPLRVWERPNVDGDRALRRQASLLSKPHHRRIFTKLRHRRQISFPRFLRRPPRQALPNTYNGPDHIPRRRGQWLRMCDGVGYGVEENRTIQQSTKYKKTTIN